MGVLADIGLMVLAAAAVGTVLRTSAGRTVAGPRLASAPDVVPGGYGHRVVDLADRPDDGAVSFETVHQNGSVTVRVAGILDERAALELAEYLSAELARGSDRLVVDTQDAGPVARIVEALAGVAFGLEQRGARLALVGRRGEMLAALVNLRANGLAGAIYVFDTIEEATRGVGHSTA